MKRQITETTCDHCGKSDYRDRVEISMTYPPTFISGICVDKQEKHLCYICYDGGIYFCRECKGFHDDDNLCEQLDAEITASAEADFASLQRQNSYR